MKGNGSITSKMINRNWVMKRKRRKLPSGADTASRRESIVKPSESSGSSKRRVKNERYLECASGKKKGNDGYYYECVVCDIGGNLLCCESCPRTYHIQCLDPPLKRIPMGKWLCPNCCSTSGGLENMKHLEPTSKRARSNIIIGKSKIGNKSSSRDKGSYRSSNHEKKRVLGKEKSSLDCETKLVEKKLAFSCIDISGSKVPAHLSHDESMEGCASDVNVENENQLNNDVKDGHVNKESKSPTREAFPSSNNGDSQKNEEKCDIRPNSPLDNGSAKDKLVPLLDASIRSARKRKRNVHFDNSKKKSSSDEREYIGDTSRKCGSKSSSNRGISYVHGKGKTVDRGSSSMSKDDTVMGTIGVHLKEEMAPVDTTCIPHGLHDAGNVVDLSTCDSHIFGEVQQVDRVLGCRLQGGKTNSSSQISVMNANEPSSQKLTITDIQSGPSRDNHFHETISDEGAGKDVSDISQNNINQSEKVNCVKNYVKVDKVQVYRRSMTKKSRDVNVMEIIKRNTKGLTSSVVVSETHLDSVESKEEKIEITEKISTDESIDVNLGSSDNTEISKNCETHPLKEIECVKEVETNMTTSRRPEKNVKESIQTESTFSDGVAVSYEFYVKWVGKSHIHNSWISETQLKVLAKRKLDNYKAKYGTAIINVCEERWKMPQRVVALRLSMSGSTDVFVKWTGLPYDECTWERIDEPVIAKLPHLTDLYYQFENWTLQKEASKEDTAKRMSDAQQGELATLVEQPRELQGGSLFPHQLEALNWLRKCWYKSKNVILADEMGLGKTVSACAFMSSLYFEFKVKLPCLVLVPLSTMPNWMSEFALWAPNLNVVEYHGCAKARALIRQYEWHANDPNGLNKKTFSYKFNVLLTTYEMVLVDSSHLRGIPWEVLVVDEGHRLKNASSKLFSMLNTFSFQHRVLLTGTPLQNNIGEMYNLLNFLQPASFPSLSSFEEKFNDLTTAEKVEELKKLVAPHMLRRLKKDAMQNIPPKTERMVPVELSSIQAEYYRAMLTKNYQILRNIGKGVPQQSMLNIVMQLRKVCNHPYLIPGTEPDSGSVEFLHEMRIKASAKLTLLHSMLKILFKEGHKVLIFSQMTKLLDILEDYLNIEFGPKTFERVDGSVSVADRQAAIARFNQDKSRFVFLLSTRSCGLGINLATADTVIIYDSDFNPHADIQAMNRAHRIGQSNRLLVYRLVVRASVEERILQLAKKKLMLDQLFVNKSGSQKEVEDILRWGTEVLFSDSCGMTGKDRVEDQRNNPETVAEIEHKNKRRAGGLGDVYQDTCAEGRTKIVWDENAILKLLDRSTIQTGSPDSAEVDLENDLLGSVKAMEWNEEVTEEQGGIDLIPAMTDDTSTQNASRKEDNLVTITEENEWDRLLRVRWEKYQNEEEAALGRGKRQRKAVSYREAYASHPSEALSESGDEENPEPEPEREYTPAGRALKEKYAKLRARQKARLAQRNSIAVHHAVDGLVRSESVVLISVPSVPDESLMTQLPVEEMTPVIDLEENLYDEALEAPKHKIDLTPSGNLDLPSKSLEQHSTEVNLPSHHDSQATNYTNLVPNSNMLPVLGLCAPNANQMEFPQKNLSRSYNRQIKHVLGHDFPFNLASCSGSSKEMNVKSHNSRNKFKQPDEPLETSHQRPSSSISGNPLSFGPRHLAMPHGNVAECSEKQSDTYADFQEKMSLPKLPFDDKLLPRYPFMASNLAPPLPDLFPGLTMGSRNDLNDTIRDLPTMPLLPNLKFPQEHGPKYNQNERDLPLMLGLGPNPASFSSIPENHRKVLENIMMRTGSSNNLIRKRAKIDFWTENELDFLWIGVRRHGRGNWNAMLRDPKLKFSKFKTAEDLSVRWEEEQLKLLDAPVFQLPNSCLPMRSSKSSLFPDISDEMMARALHGSRFCGPSKFQSHLTDMKLGFGDVPMSLHHMKPSDQLGLHNEHILPLPSWNADRLRANLFGDSSASPADRPGTSSNVFNNPPILLSSFGLSSESLSLNCSRNFDLLQKGGEKGVSMYKKLPGFLDKSLNFLHDSCNNAGSSDHIGSSIPADYSKGQILLSKAKEEAGESSSAKDKLPHWLREAVNAPTKPTDPDLPPTISAIAHSVRLLYGEDNSTIPPFVAPGPPPLQPKEPRWSLKRKRRKLRTHSQYPVDIAGSGLNFDSRVHEDNAVSTSISLPPPLPLCVAGTSGHLRAEPNVSIPPLNLNMEDPSTSSVHPNNQKKSSFVLSPSPEVVQLVASCVASASVPDATRSSLLESQICRPKSFDQGGGLAESRDAYGKQKAKQSSSPLRVWGPLSKIKLDQTDSEDSSKTQSGPTRPKQPDEKEISSEGTVSDHRACNLEP